MDDIITAVEGQCATVTINRPRRRNAMTMSMWKAIPGIMKDLEADGRVRAILLTGAQGNFCAGADIAEFGELRATEAQADSYEEAVNACCDAVFSVSKPTIAAVDGYCLGGGCHLAMSCDFRYAGAGAVFGIPAARLSIVYGVSGTAKLLALVGLANAKRILYGGESLTAEEALRIGLADGLFDDPAAAATAFAQKLEESAPLTISGSKSILNGLAMGPGALDPDVAARAIRKAIHSADYREGRAAFAGKRPPRFRGR